MKGHKHKKLDRRGSINRTTEPSVRLLLNSHATTNAPQNLLTSPPKTERSPYIEGQQTKTTSDILKGMTLADFYIGSCYND